MVRGLEVLRLLACAPKENIYLYKIWYVRVLIYFYGVRWGKILHSNNNNNNNCVLVQFGAMLRLYLYLIYYIDNIGLTSFVNNTNRYIYPSSYTHLTYVGIPTTPSYPIPIDILYTCLLVCLCFPHFIRLY